MQKKNRVLFLVNIPSPYRVDFFNELGKFCDLTVLFEERSSNERETSWYKNNFSNFKGVFLKGTKISREKLICFSVIKYLKRDLFDIFVIGGYSTLTGMLAIEVLKNRKIRFILNSDGGMLKEESKIKYLIKKRFISSASFWLSTGNHTSNYLIYYGVKKEYIYSYPFTSLFKKDIIEELPDFNTKEKIKQRLNIREEKVIISVGRMIYSKGFDILIKVCSKIPDDYGIYIVGGKPSTDHLELVKKLKIKNVHFVDFKTKEELKLYYIASNLFVLPTRGDVWGLVINEAMAFGLPVITTDKCVAGLELVKDDENGFVIPVNDSNSLAKRIKYILENEMVSDKMSKSSLSKIKKYTIENMAIEHINFFNSILVENGNK